MATNIYGSYDQFLARDNKSDNGVSVEFASKYLETRAEDIKEELDWSVVPAPWVIDNESNEGCWNCVDCSHLVDCSYCCNTHYSQHCDHLTDCWDCFYCSYLTNNRHQRYTGGKNNSPRSCKLFNSVKVLVNKMWGIVKLKGKY
tara:strand:+ start:3833 stop:4264 length:432 start_codon:yes stop_codon:yes gene_type:complete